MSFFKLLDTASLSSDSYLEKNIYAFFILFAKNMLMLHSSELSEVGRFSL